MGYPLLEVAVFLTGERKRSSHIEQISLKKNKKSTYLPVLGYYFVNYDNMLVPSANNCFENVSRHAEKSKKLDDPSLGPSDTKRLSFHKELPQNKSVVHQFGRC